MKAKIFISISMIVLISVSALAQQQMTVISPGQAANGVYCAGQTANVSSYAYTCDCHNGMSPDNESVDLRVQVQAPQGDIDAAMAAAQSRCEKHNNAVGWTVYNCY